MWMRLFSRSSRAVILCAELWTYATQYSEMYNHMSVADMQSKVCGLLAELFTQEEIEAASNLIRNLPDGGNEQ